MRNRHCRLFDTLARDVLIAIYPVQWETHSKPTVRPKLNSTLSALPIGRSVNQAGLPE